MQNEAQIIKQIVGIDVSKDSLEVTFGTMSSQAEKKYSDSTSFQNATEGFKRLLSWAMKNKKTDACEIIFVMEATGVYYENLAYFLYEHSRKVAVLLPNKTKNYARTLDIKSKTDKIDSHMITQFGLEREFRLWSVPTPIFKELKSLCREYSTITKLTVQIQNQLHAKEHSYKPTKSTVDRLKQQIRFSKHQISEIEKEIRRLVNQDKELKDKIDNITRVEGLGFMSVVRVVAETNGFALFENGKQLASYAGVDVVHEQSGTSERKPYISRKGNSLIRQALYMPAICASRYNKNFKKLYIRLVIKKNAKKVAIIAVERKLLLLIFTLWKNNSPYDPDYLSNIQNHQHATC